MFEQMFQQINNKKVKLLTQMQSFVQIVQINLQPHIIYIRHEVLII